MKWARKRIKDICLDVNSAVDPHVHSLNCQMTPPQERIVAHRPPNSSPGSEHPSTPQQLTIQAGFSYEELAVATNFFSDADFLGEGGFGCVYKGILRNGQEVAVKQLKPDSRQGDHEFQVEVQIISRLHHKHLVSLKGCCISGAKRLLVFEYVPNNTLKSSICTVMLSVAQKGVACCTLFPMKLASVKRNTFYIVFWHL